MPCYRLLAYAKPDTTPKDLARVFQNVARVVFRERGQLRTVENLGVRPVSTPFRVGGERIDDARMVMAFYDVSPLGLQVIASTLQQERAVMNFFHTSLDDGLGKFNGGKKKNKKPITDAFASDRTLFNAEAFQQE